MKRSHIVPLGCLTLCLLGVAFCLWAHLGNSFALCFTAGCSLYQDTTIAGVSMWWFGLAGFALLALLCLLRLTALAAMAAALGLALDTCLLVLMAFTAPCVNCLIAALILFLAYLSLRAAAEGGPAPAGPGAHTRRRPVLALLWGIFFIVNLGAVARAEAGLWALSDDPETASVRVFFSPSCPSCRQAVEKLSGRVDVAFHPLAENDQDVFRAARMERELASGASMIEALTEALKEPEGASWRLWTPDMILLRLRLLRNKAHIFSSGSTVVPYIEYRGLPAHLAATPERRGSAARKGQRPMSGQDTPAPTARPRSQGGDPTLPLEPSVAGYCDGGAPCEDDGAPWQTRRGGQN